MSQLWALPLGAAARLEATARCVVAAALAVQPAPGVDAALDDVTRRVALGLVEAAIAVPIRACSQLLHAFAECAIAWPERSARNTLAPLPIGAQTLAALPIGAQTVATLTIGAHGVGPSALGLQSQKALAQLLNLAPQLAEVVRGPWCALLRALGLRSLGLRTAARFGGALGGALCEGRANEEGGDEEGGPAVHGWCDELDVGIAPRHRSSAWRAELNPAIHNGFRRNATAHTDFTNRRVTRSPLDTRAPARASSRAHAGPFVRKRRLAPNRSTVPGTFFRSRVTAEERAWHRTSGAARSDGVQLTGR
jgi:hypothetical protein